MKKLACFSDTWAEPRRKPLSPAASISRPAESPSGLVKTEPALKRRPGWCSRRHLTMALTAACSAAADPGVTDNSAATTTWDGAAAEER